MWKSKFRAQKTNGFPSKLENAVHDLLLTRELAGEISEIKQQQAITLKHCELCGDKLTWKVDFSFIRLSDGKKVYCEAKGCETSGYRKRLKAWKKNPPFDLEIWKGSWQKPYLDEFIKSRDAA